MFQKIVVADEIVLVSVALTSTYVSLLGLVNAALATAGHTLNGSVLKVILNGSAAFLLKDPNTAAEKTYPISTDKEIVALDALDLEVKTATTATLTVELYIAE